MTMKKYMVYLDDGKGCYKVAVPAESEEKAREYVQGNGEVIAVKDVTNNFPLSVDKVAQVLQNAGFGKFEIDFIVRAFQEINICDVD